MLKEINNRRSIRSYKENKIDISIIKELLEAGLKAPSAKNNQPWKFLIVSDIIKNKIADKMIELYGPNKTSEVLKTVPYLVLVYNSVCDYLSYLSIGACIENILLEATCKDLGTLWVGYIKKIEDYVKELVGVDLELVSAIAIGVKDEEPVEIPRVGLEEVLIESEKY